MKINYNNDLEKVLTAAFGGIGTIAIFINLHLKGYGAENWLDAIVNISGLIVVLAVFITSIRSYNKSKTFTDVARAKLEDLKKQNTDILLGPRYNRDNYDSEKGKGIEYLFVTNDKEESSKRAKLIPIQPLEEGVLVIYIQKGTLVWGLKYPSEQATPDEIKKIQNEVKNAVLSLIQEKYAKLFEVLPNTKDDTAIIIDFNENEMGKKKFAKAIEECTKEAVSKLKELRIKKLK